MTMLCGQAQRLVPTWRTSSLNSIPHRLDDVLEIRAFFGQTADVVVALDDIGITGAGLDDVRVNRALARG